MISYDSFCFITGAKELLLAATTNSQIAKLEERKSTISAVTNFDQVERQKLLFTFQIWYNKDENQAGWRHCACKYKE